MIIVTGAAGFVGSNLVRALNAAGRRDVIAVDDLTDGDRFRNLADCQIADYLDRDEFRALVRRGLPGIPVEAILHQGACADTTESDGRLMMDVNYAYAKEVLHAALDRRAALVYASSASVYGLARRCVEEPACERPLNVYAYSKWQFDNYVRRLIGSLPASATVVGLRYFNVYGPREAHKGRMASMVWQLYRQLVETGVARLFSGTDGYADGEQRRDFVAVADVAAVNLHFALASPPRRTIVNVGTGVARSFNDIARTLIARLGRGRIEYLPFPEALRGKYQSFTRADLTNLRAAGYAKPFLTLEQGIDQLLAELAGAVDSASGQAA
jgi:ADP-L-glycero-D-manno-heptose 6-epimerase